MDIDRPNECGQGRAFDVPLQRETSMREISRLVLACVSTLVFKDRRIGAVPSALRKRPANVVDASLCTASSPSTAPFL